tara:strand:+ start:161 stop:1621 length:1461 start_codon:yes stop_codon:yes gene_type:complete
MTPKGFGHKKHPVSIKIFDDSVLVDAEPVEAIYYEITNIKDGCKYIGSHKLIEFGNWLDDYYHSSQNDEFYNMFWGQKKDLFIYKIVAGGTHADMQNLENKIGTENQVHTNPMYYNKAIPKSGYKAPARIEFCKNTAEKIMQGFFDIKDDDDDYILINWPEINDLMKYQARKYVDIDENNSIKEIRTEIIEDNGIDNTEPITQFGTKTYFDFEKVLMIDGNRTIAASTGLKQAKGGLKLRILPDWYIEENNITKEEMELIAEYLNPRKKIKKLETDDDTMIDRMIKNLEERNIPIRSEHNKKYLQNHNCNGWKIGKLFPKAEKKYRIAEDKKEAGSVYIDWENDKDPYVKSHSKMIDKLNNSGKIITHTGSAGNDTKLFTNSYDILMKNINNEKIEEFRLYVKIKHGDMKDEWKGSTQMITTNKGVKTKNKVGTIERVRLRLGQVIGVINFVREQMKPTPLKKINYDIITLDYLKDKYSFEENDNE